MSAEYEGPYKVRLDSSVSIWDVVCPDYAIPCNNKEQAENLAYHLNTAYHSRDAELAAKDASIKELEEQVKELTFHRDRLIPSTPCPRCGHPALFICSLGSLNCGCCCEHVGWDALTRHGG